VPEATATVVPLSETSPPLMPVTAVLLAVGWKITSMYCRLFDCAARGRSVSVAVVSTNDHFWSTKWMATELQVVTVAVQ